MPSSGADGRHGRSGAAGAGTPCAPTDRGGLAEQPRAAGKPVPTLLVDPVGKLAHPVVCERRERGFSCSP